MSIGKLLSQSLRYGWSAMLVAAFVFPILAIVVFLIPAKFDSNAQLLVRLGRGAVSIDPTANLTQTISLQETRLSQVNSVKELLASREVRERVVNRVGIDRIMEPHGLLENIVHSASLLIPSLSADPLGEFSADEVEAQLALEEACKKLESSIGISAPKEAYTISLHVRTSDPFLSRDLLRAYVEEYQKFHVESHQSRGSLAFFEAQADEAHERANVTQTALRDLKTDRGVVDLGAAKASLSTVIAQIKKDLLSSDSELASVNAEISTLKSEIGTLPSQIAAETTTGIPNLTGTGVRQRLYDLEIKYQEAAVKLTPNHPKMVALRQQLEAAAEIANAQDSDKPQTRNTVNPVRQSLELKLRTTYARLEGLKERRQNLAKQLDDMTSELARLNQDEVEINQAAWEASLSESEYIRTATARATARQIDALDSQFLSEISVVQQPTLSIKKAFPKRGILIVLAMMFSMALGCGQAVLRAAISLSAKDEDRYYFDDYPHSHRNGWDREGFRGDSHRSDTALPKDDSALVVS